MKDVITASGTKVPTAAIERCRSPKTGPRGCARRRTTPSATGLPAASSTAAPDLRGPTPGPDSVVQQSAAVAVADAQCLFLPAHGAVLFRLGQA
ncbi:hypothetical protein [Streptomyces sp. DSM 40750]|uniref:hypothetical protein n=1 Tax=Streptomyces sp. DSM 40750 TaxID=2801030 RepID=UPI00214CF163|nr:hypothetical protein [Streptomyces sp. DSM 40750]UUU26404.1 hypothetical protein JIX55_42800 [Streptomyces sp. DSM 40750]